MPCVGGFGFCKTNIRRTTMLIATDNQVFTLENGTPTQRLAIDGIRCLDEGVHCSAIGLADGQVVVLANGQAQPPTADHRHRRFSRVHRPAVRRGRCKCCWAPSRPHVYCLNGDEPARRMESFDALECRQSWYTPWGGPPAVRSLARSGRLGFCRYPRRQHHALAVTEALLGSR